MKFLIDENVPVGIKDNLKKSGHHVIHVNNVLKGKTDREVFEYAQKNKMCIITKDVDFRTVLRNKIIEDHFGVIKLCGILTEPSDKIKKIIEIYKGTIKNRFIEIYNEEYIDFVKKYTKKGKFKQFQKIRKLFEC